MVTDRVGKCSVCDRVVRLRPHPHGWSLGPQVVGHACRFDHRRGARICPGSWHACREDRIRALQLQVHSLEEAVRYLHQESRHYLSIGEEGLAQDVDRRILLAEAKLQMIRSTLDRMR